MILVLSPWTWATPKAARGSPTRPTDPNVPLLLLLLRAIPLLRATMLRPLAALLHSKGRAVTVARWATSMLTAVRDWQTSGATPLEVVSMPCTHPHQRRQKTDHRGTYRSG